MPKMTATVKTHFPCARCNSFLPIVEGGSMCDRAGKTSCARNHLATLREELGTRTFPVLSKDGKSVTIRTASGRERTIDASWLNLRDIPPKTPPHLTVAPDPPDD